MTFWPEVRYACGMSSIACGGVRLDAEEAGAGRALVLIHGAWTDRLTWDPVFAGLSSRHRVIRYSRRGYGGSQSPGCALSEHGADLLALLRTLGLDRVVLVGNSLGGIIALRACLEAPNGLIENVIIHEPPFLKLLQKSDDHRALWSRLSVALENTLNAIRAGEHRLAGQLYVETMASCPGAWDYVPPELQEEFVRHAPAFLAESTGLGETELDVGGLRALEHRFIITRGERSTPYLRLIADQMCSMLSGARKHVFAGAGHVPHQSCPRAFVEFLFESLKSIAV